MKYAFIGLGRAVASVKKQCRWLGISRSGYYDWKRRGCRSNDRTHRQQAIDDAVSLAFEARKQRYGSPRLHTDLNESGFAVSLNTVADSMQRQGLVAKAGRKYKATTNSAHSLPIAPNLLGQEFTCSRINEKWCGDITYLWTDEGWLYLAVVLDLYSRRVIGWSMSHRMTKKLVCDAMKMAIKQRAEFSGVIMHTDRGSQYCSKQFQRLLRSHGITPSMSRKGDCYDNACAESFFHTLKIEAIHGERFPTRQLMRETVFEYIEADYNRIRHHTTIGSTSPVNFEMAIAA